MVFVMTSDVPSYEISSFAGSSVAFSNFVVYVHISAGSLFTTYWTKIVLFLFNLLLYFTLLPFFSHNVPLSGLVVHNWLNSCVSETVPTKEKVVGNSTDLKYNFVHISITSYAYHWFLPC